MPSSPARPLLQLDFSTLATSIGDDWLTTLGAFTALRKRFRHVEIAGEKVVTAPARDITGQLTGQARLAALLNAAWLPMATELLARQDAPTLYLLALPAWLHDIAETENGNSALQQMVNAFAAHCHQFDLNVYAVEAVCGGAETCHVALARAFNRLESDAPPARVVLLAADSLCDPEVLQRDRQAGRIYGQQQSSGWIPGEAAACLLLTPVDWMRDVPKNRYAMHPPMVSSEPAQTPRWPGDMLGDGALLHQAIHGALHHSNVLPQQVSHHVSDSDGSRWRLEDETGAVNRLLTEPDHSWSCAPLQAAELLGQVGAAWGAVSWALVAGLQQLDLMIISAALSSSEDISGRCAATLMERSPH